MIDANWLYVDEKSCALGLLHFLIFFIYLHTATFPLTLFSAA